MAWYRNCALGKGLKGAAQVQQQEVLEDVELRVAGRVQASELQVQLRAKRLQVELRGVEVTTLLHQEELLLFESDLREEQLNESYRCIV